VSEYGDDDQVPVPCACCRRRAGLYKQLAELKALVAEYREDPEKNAALKVPCSPREIM
jgi:hypothetical protein